MAVAPVLLKAVFDPVCLSRLNELQSICLGQLIALNVPTLPAMLTRRDKLVSKLYGSFSIVLVAGNAVRYLRVCVKAVSVVILKYPQDLSPPFYAA